MADEDGVLFTEAAAARVVSATRKVEGMAPLRRNPVTPARNSPKPVAPIRVTDATAAANGYYPGQVLLEDGIGGYEDLRVCWVKNLRTGAPGATKHWARLAGIHTDGEPIFEVIADVGGVEVEFITGICVIADTVIDGGEF